MLGCAPDRGIHPWSSLHVSRGPPATAELAGEAVPRGMRAVMVRACWVLVIGALLALILLTPALPIRQSPIATSTIGQRRAASAGQGGMTT